MQAVILLCGRYFFIYFLQTHGADSISQKTIPRHYQLAVLNTITNSQFLALIGTALLAQFAERCQFVASTSAHRCSRERRPASVETTLNHRLLRISSPENIPSLLLKPHQYHSPICDVCGVIMQMGVVQ